MKLKLIITAIICCLTLNNLYSQISENISLFGQLDPEPIRYSGSFGYIDSLGNEYALLGAHDHLFVISIDDSTNIHVLDSVAGPGSNWREIAVIGETAFVVTEGSGTGEGMQIIDLSYLPDSVHLITTFDSTFTRGHMVQKNYAVDSSYIYVSGTTPDQGVHIIDISDPANPVEISRYEPYYIHDIHVKGNTMYASAIYEGTLDVVDITDRTNPVLLEQISYPSAFTHSAFTTEDDTHLFVADETDGLPARIWNIEDINNITEVSQYSGNLLSLVH
ncbi:MAG: choice-of-anchor B family protein, partial [Bacteroidia bacterium]|nr:choice-of-anchor B family protein [Bacteroidia bacterium]